MLGRGKFQRNLNPHGVRVFGGRAAEKQRIVARAAEGRDPYLGTRVMFHTPNEPTPSVKREAQRCGEFSDKNCSERAEQSLAFLNPFPRLSFSQLTMTVHVDIAFIQRRRASMPVESIFSQIDR